MSKLGSMIQKIFNRSEGTSTTQMRAGSETGQVYGLRIVKSIPFFGNKPFKDQYKILLTLLIPAALATTGSVIYSSIERDYNAQRIELSTQMQMLSQRTARLAAQVSNGDSRSADELRDSIKQVNQNIDALKNGRSGLRASDGASLEKLDKFITEWRRDEKHLNELVANVDKLIELRGQAEFIKDSGIVAARLTDSVRILQIDAEASLSTLYLTAALTTTFAEMSQLMQTLLTAVLIPDDALPSFDRITKVITESLGYLNPGQIADAKKKEVAIAKSQSFDVYIPKTAQDRMLLERLNALRQISVTFTQDIGNFKKTVNDVRSAKQAAYNVGLTADQNLNVLKDLTGQYNLEQKDIDRLNMLAISFALLSLLIGFFWIWLKLQETRLTTAQVEESIMHLMSDLMSISDGNLATRARVAENITGSIADSLNLTIARLNRTLSDVKESSQTVRDGADQMTNDASVILEAVRDQSNKIREASSSVNSIADSVQAVAFAAEQSSEVAEMQRNVTEQGREAVKNTIAAMNAIREQIQNTAKRIKRVGESAQEIDEIIELISDTTEQTNVLAMNASIQAAAAGEAGRGFRAVATEVQRLAERSDQSLRKIVGLIRTMQSETQNAVSAMEASTQEVVNGAQTTSRAGEALTKIEEVSSELNGLIAAITEATQQQTNEAKVITDSMSDILQISTSTARGVEQTTTGIQTIASLAEELDNAMDQFTLQ